MVVKQFSCFIVVLVFGLVVNIVNNNAHKWTKNQIFTYDVFGYHNYLPALFKYHDIDQYKFLDTIESVYQPTGGEYKKYGLHPVEATGKLCNQYPIGVAIFQLPGYLLADVAAKHSNQFPADGYSQPYQHATVISTLIFSVLGLFILALFLSSYVNVWITHVVILCIGFGTNFFHYAGLESGLSHAYLFFLYASIIYLSKRWYEKPSFLHSSLIGLVIGLATITRPLDFLMVLIPLLWPTANRFTLWKLNRVKLLVSVLCFLIAISPQLWYWHEVTGRWIYYSYSSVDYFEFNRFRLIHGLFSYRKGWLIYTPLVLVGFWGLYKMYHQSSLRGYAFMTLAFFVPMLYLVFSWHNWYYGWSYGCRALVQTLPLFALPLGLLLQQIFSSKKWIQQIAYSTLLIWLIFLNLFQSWQFNNGLIHGTLMNEKTYWRVFLRTENNDDIRQAWYRQQQMDSEMPGY
jgi:hypothetical protein